MDEDTVVVLKEQLTDEMIEAGAQLTQKLLDMELPIAVAMWFFLPESNQWRLLFASPNLDTEGPLAVYTKIQEAQKALGPDAKRVPFTSIGLRQTNERLVKALQSEVATGPGLARVRLYGSAVRGNFIDDALIYRSAA